MPLETVIVKDKISKEKLQSLAQKCFGDMVKGVIDIQTQALALGGELHADLEAILVQSEHHQDHLWGINIYVDEPFPDNIEFDSVINIRPSQENHSRDVLDPAIRQKIIDILRQRLEGHEL
jgi:hypothetical protein